MLDDGVTILPARMPDDLVVVRALFGEYFASLGLDLSFQDTEAELAGLPGKYAQPAGALLLARSSQGEVMGCVALRPLPGGACEMKRLYVRASARGRALGRRLAEAIIGAAGAAGYRSMKLDSLGTMAAAQGLYASLGFRPTAPYYDNPIPGATYLELILHRVDQVAPPQPGPTRG